MNVCAQKNPKQHIREAAQPNEAELILSMNTFSHARTEADSVLKLRKILLDGTPPCARTATEAIVMQVHAATVLDIVT